MDPEHSQLIMLCEGENDYRFLNTIIKDKLHKTSYRNKDLVLRRIHQGIILARVIVILEEGKERLLKNIRILVSKMRSLPGKNHVIAMFDADNSAPGNLIEKIHTDLQSLVNDKRRFPKTKPTLNTERADSNCCTIAVKYGSGALLRIHVVVIPYSLEYWEKYVGLDPENIRNQSWYRKLIGLLQKLGVKTVEDGAQFT